MLLGCKRTDKRAYNQIEDPVLRRAGGSHEQLYGLVVLRHA